MPLGGGAFGTVYKCLDKCSNQYVAIKLFDPKKQAFNNNSTRQSLYDELMFHEKIGRHPHIIHLLGYALEENVVLAFPLRLINLITYLRTDGKNASLNILGRYCAQIAQGMMFIHFKNIIHGDLKAANILVKDEFTVQIADFGLACNATETKAARGTITHVAYEYITDEETITKKGDIWSYGVTVWEIYERGMKKPYSDRLKHVNQFSLVEFFEKGKILNKPSEMKVDLWGKVRSCFAKDKHLRPDFSQLYITFIQLDVPQEIIQGPRLSESSV